jgi:hypothetical protein
METLARLGRVYQYHGPSRLHRELLSTIDSKTFTMGTKVKTMESSVSCSPNELTHSRSGSPTPEATPKSIISYVGPLGSHVTGTDDCR